jgi:hypothetical protein
MFSVANQPQLIFFLFCMTQVQGIQEDVNYYVDENLVRRFLIGCGAENHRRSFSLKHTASSNGTDTNITSIQPCNFRILILQRTRKSTRISIWKRKKTTLRWELMTIRTTMMTTSSANLTSQHHQKRVPKNNTSQNLRPQKQQPSLYQRKVSQHVIF